MPVLRSEGSRDLIISSVNASLRVAATDDVPATVEETHSAAVAVISAGQAGNDAAPSAQPQEPEAIAEHHEGASAGAVEPVNRRAHYGMARADRLRRQAAERHEQSLVAHVAVVCLMKVHALGAKEACDVLRLSSSAFGDHWKECEGQKVDSAAVEAFVRQNLNREKLRRILVERQRQREEAEQAAYDKEMKEWGLFLAMQQLRNGQRLTILQASARLKITPSRYSHLLECFGSREDPPADALEQRNILLVTVGNVPLPDEAPADGANPMSLFEYIQRHGTDEGYEPRSSALDETNEYVPTDAPPGSRRRIEVFADRVKRGLPLSHPQDWQGYEPPDAGSPPPSNLIHPMSNVDVAGEGVVS
ncbi:MAG: hypothetical protein PHI23_01800 [Candidatus Peribacteraceae bacterium]|nr:hypothetical protein [Candidatus Peribacteraceae bacterium]